MTDVNSLPSERSDDAIRFPSLDALRTAHGELLRRFRAEGSAPEVILRIEDFIHRGKATGALLDADTDRWAAQSQLDYWATQLYRPDYEPPDATLDEFDPELAPELPDEICPYVGLDAFRELNQSVFFGRVHLVQELIRKLEDVRFMAVVGSSGSGKSSVVRAGLIPALKNDGLPASGGWKYFAPMVPGSNSLLNLARAWMPHDVNAVQLEKEAELYRQNPVYFATAIAERFKDDVVLVVDQFEEIFTLCTDEIVRRRFVENLISLSQLRTAEHRVIITMRSDFEANVAKIPELQTIFEQSVVRVTPLNAAELREAIEAPAAKIGLKFEEGVVDALLNDTLGEPAALPLLQFTLLKLWENREHNRITGEAYKKLGGGRQALARSADEFYNQLIPEEQVTMRRILLKMVRPGEGLEVTSNRVPRAALYQKSEANDRIDRVLARLIHSRLVRFSEGDHAGDAQVEVAHEALVRNWPRLVEWLEEERVVLRQRQRLTTAAEEWQRLGRDLSALWSGTLLEEARRYDDLNNLETQFLAASDRRQRRGRQVLSIGISTVILLLVTAVLVFRNQSIANEHIATTAQAASTSSAAQRATAEVASTLAVEQAKIAQDNAEEAQRQATISRASELAAQSAIERDKNLRAALLLGVEAFHTYDTYQTRGTLMDNLQVDPPLQRYLGDQKGPVNSVAFSPDGKTLASARCNELNARNQCLGGDIVLWDAVSGQPIGQLLINETGSMYFVAFSPDGKTLASIGCGELVESNSDVNCLRDEILLWDLSSSQPVSRTLIGSSDSVASVAFSPDGATLASAGCSELDSKNNCIRGEVDLWDVASGQPIGQPLIGHASFVGDIVFSPDGTTLASAGCGEAGQSDFLDDCTHGEILLWDVASRQPVRRTIAGRIDHVGYFTFSPAGTTLAAVGCGETVELNNFGECSREEILLWDVVSGQSIVQPLVGYTGSVVSLAFSPDGATLATGTSDHTISFWDVSSGQPIGQQFTRHTGYVLSLAFSSERGIMASGAHDGRVILWQRRAANQNLLVRQRLRGDILAFSPDGQTLATGVGGLRLLLWDIDADPESGQAIGERIDNSPAGFSFVTDIVFSPNGKLVVWTSVDGILFLWNVETNQAIDQKVNEFVDSVWSVAFSPDGKILALGSDDGTVILWDMETKQPIGEPLSGHRRFVSSLAFSPDGKILASGGSDATIRVWEIETRRIIGQPLSGHRGNVSSLAFSPDGKTLASSARFDNLIILWNVDAQQPIGQPLIGHRRGVNSVAFSPDGRILASGGGDNNIILWDVETHRPIGQPLRWIVTLDEDEDRDSVFSVAFNPDGKLLASSSERSSPILWDVDPQSWTERTCQRAGRNFTREEWAYYFPNEGYRITCPQWPAGQ